MKILHLLSNWKWSERSEPVIDLAISQSSLGAKVCFVCGRAPENCPVADVYYNAKEKGLEYLISLSEMSKHFNMFSVFRGIQKIRKIITDENPDIIHCHMRNAHFLAGLAQKKDRALLVRTIYDPEQLGGDLRSKCCNKYFSHGLIVMTEQTKQLAVDQSFPAQKIEIIEPGIDALRFSPERSLEQDLDFVGSLEENFVAGLVTRIRPTRRLDVAMQAIDQLHGQYPQLRLLLVGRGRPGAFESVVDQPASEMGIRDLIIPTGYCQGDDLVAAYRKMDVLIYTMPGTDKTCRTVREAMAAGVPVIAPKIGFLTQLIEDKVNGRLVDFNPESFALALKELMDSPEYLKRLSQGTLESAKERFDLSVQAEKTLQFYNFLLKTKSSSAR